MQLLFHRVLKLKQLEKHNNMLGQRSKAVHMLLSGVGCLKIFMTLVDLKKSLKCREVLGAWLILDF